MGVNGLDEYLVPEHVKDYLRKIGFALPLDDMEPLIRSWNNWMSVCARAAGITAIACHQHPRTGCCGARRLVSHEESLHLIGGMDVVGKASVLIACTG